MMKTLRKNRKDIALTLDLARSIIERLETGEPLLKRGALFILLDDPKWADKVPVGTYNSWVARNTIPVDSIDNLGLNELLTIARERIRKEKRVELLKLGEKGIKKILSIPLEQTTVQKRINKNGEIVSITTTKAINPATVQARLKVAMFTLEKLDAETYGKTTKNNKKAPVFSLAELRRYKEEKRK